MKDIMLDLETMDNVQTAAIVAIGAVQCDLTTGKIGETFYKVVDLNNNPGSIDPNTVYWWMSQSYEARRALLIDGKLNARKACEALIKWINYLKPANEHLRLWGNGASFDNAIIRETFKVLKLDFPIRFWNDRDMRTIVGFYPNKLQEIWKLENRRSGTHHNALDDAKHQIKYCSDILKELGVKELY
jgi:exodeoxyribonuclease VIII